MTDPRFQSPLADFVPSGTHALDMAEVRRRIGAWYALHEGMRSSGLEAGAYEAFLFPNDSPAWRARAADEMYSCALRFLACCRVLGVPHPLLKVPYAQRIGHAVGDCDQVARTYRALVEGHALAGYEPDEGDALCQHGRYGPHVSCVVEATWYGAPNPGRPPVLELWTVDGGQGGKGDMQIQSNKYVWQPSAHVASSEPPAHSRAAPGPSYPLVWIVDMATLVLEAGLLA